MDLDLETIELLQEEFQNEFILPQRENISDSLLARQLQDQFQREMFSRNSNSNESSDILLARSLQEQLKNESKANISYGDLVYDKKTQKESSKSLTDPSWEVIDPTPDIHVLFMAFNNKFFWGKLDSVCVSWSKRMKRCAGICSYQGRGGLCHITLSEPLLKLRPRKDLIETLLHEMIHALLFVTNNNKDRDGHGPEFHKHMYRINKDAGTNITVYHTFHDEVELYLQHWWRCDGPCQKWKPYFGTVRRSMNRAPGPNDRWWGEHSRNCGGTFIKIKSPEPKAKASTKTKENKPVGNIREFISSSKKIGHSVITSSKLNDNSSKPQTKVKSSASNSINSNIHNISTPNAQLSTSVTIPSKTNNIHGFSSSNNKTFAKGGTKLNTNTIVVTKKPVTNSQENNKNNETKTTTPKMKFNTGNSSNSHDTTIDYAVVRNHWVNKFSNNQPSKNLQPLSTNKRKSSEPNLIAAKAAKLSQTSSQDSIDCESAPCPVCNIAYPIEELNTHLDICLSKPKNNSKECIICMKQINESEYQQHVNKCLEKNFGDDDSPKSNTQNDCVILTDENSMDGNYVNCSFCKNKIPIVDFEEHIQLCKNRTKCPECGKKVDSSSYDVHVAGCLIAKFDKMNENSNEGTSSNQSEETLSCLVCGKNILKNNLYSHLEVCMKEVFDEKEEQSDVMEDKDDKLYNCPFCLKLMTEIDMSDHIDICLKTVDCDLEAQENKTLFLSEID